VDSVVDSYSRPYRTFDDLYKLARKGHVDPLEEFNETCEKGERLSSSVCSTSAASAATLWHQLAKGRENSRFRNSWVY
jgi:hypothetical protein